ncbi:pilus assembly protein PilM [Anaerosalibacter massiliensis]|uniref:Chaperone protein DnaK n=1 Tax=Anaerosalibacter massiliensis TaxID=1347392 RepID=A0A9X2S451_9FIRM|nr:cell division FtsA domain-containing protein [Anaerosalibacter massiliensis]MCR2043138.1 pilus assembly protein PilM [Anaerosalibacter massiliensis]
MVVPDTNIKNSNDLIFSLDIGTKTIVGIVGVHENGKFKIIESCIKEHNRRNMYDGQIHDIEGVTRIIKEIKKELEEKLEIPLKNVSIAAAGRALKTYRFKTNKDIDSTIEIDNNMIKALEMEGIQNSQKLMDEEIGKKDLRYYCIGYSVVNYFLDDNFIEKLEGHKGKKIGVDLLATFLPQIVIDSLYVAVNRAGLEVSNMTLEPIAAINVAIKENLRLLNLALVDIGAGTSDIAITKDGSIIAYAMTSIAGDEITEAIAKSYLLDFDSSEKLKVRLNKEEEHKFFDVVGIEHQYSTEEIIKKIEGVIDKLAAEISKKIIEYNGVAPSAVFLIGGSSQIPKLNEYIAKYLKLPEERVVLRDLSFIESIEGISKLHNGPDMITPIGIAMEGANNKYKNFIQIYLNGEEIRVFNTDSVKVADVLILVGYNPRKLIPERGKDFIYYLNNEKKIEKGEIGKPAEIIVNGAKGNLKTVLQNKDFVEVKDSTRGEIRDIYLYNIIPIYEKVILNGEEVRVLKEAKVNGEIIEENIQIHEGDRIEYYKNETVYNLLEDLNIDEYNIFKNGEQVGIYENIKDKDEIDIKLKSNKNFLETEENEIDLIVNGESKKFTYTEEEFLFVNIFNYIDFDLSKPKGKLVLKVNNRDAQYMKVLENGDNVEIYWSK